MVVTGSLRLLICGVCLLAAFPVPAAAAWPERGITLVHGFGAGGNIDTVSRIVAERLSVRLGQSVVVEARAGAGGRIAAAQVARAAADGYTLIVLPGGHAVTAAMHEKLAYDTLEDFSFISLMTQVPLILVTYPDHPVKSVAELIKTPKSSSNPMFYGSPGEVRLSTWPVRCSRPWRRWTFSTLPPRRLGRVGHVARQAHRFCVRVTDPGPGAGEERPAPRAGNDRPEAVLCPARCPNRRRDHPWLRGGLVAGCGRPAEAAGRHRQAAQRRDRRRHGRSPKWWRSFGVLGTLPLASTPEGFKQRVAADVAKWSKVVADAGIKRVGSEK